jgi:uncharacterized protein YjbI with pentapeptide repeats
MSDSQRSVEQDLKRHSVEGTAAGVGGAVAPRATLAIQQAWIMFSYAWLNQGKVGKQLHSIQAEFFEELERQLKYPPDRYKALPVLNLWRDERRLRASEPAAGQLDAICREAFLCVIMMSDKYPHSAACLEEAACFIDDDGNNRDTKACIVVALNVGRDHAPARFSNNIRLWVTDGAQQPIAASWRKMTAGQRQAFVRDISSEIFQAAAERFLRPTLSPATGNPVAAFATVAAFEHRFDQTVGPRARRARSGADIAVAPAAPAEPEGIDIVQHLADWACASDGPRLTALLGEFGMGKTVTCQLLTQELLKRRQDSAGATPLPLYFDLRNIGRVRDGRDPTLESLIDDMLRRPGETPPTAAEVIAYARQNAAVVIFDGLDEVTNKLSSEQAIGMYRQLLAIVPAEAWSDDGVRRRAAMAVGAPSPAIPPATRAPGPRIVVSCRSHYFRDIADQRGFITGLDRAGLSPESDIQTFIMLPFSPEQVTAYLQLHLPEAEAARVIELIRETYDLGQLAQRPILLNFIRAVASQLEQEKLEGRKINVSKLYDILVTQTLARDEKKHVIPRLEKIALLQKLAHSMHKGDLEELTNTALDEWFIESATDFPRLARVMGSIEGLQLSEIFLQDIRNASLLVRVGDGGFRFAHTSIREYFLADKLFSSICKKDLMAFDMKEPSRETIQFMLYRFEVCDEADRTAFAKNYPLTMAEGQPVSVRTLGFMIWLASLFALPRPPVIDMSGFDWLESEDINHCAIREEAEKRGGWADAPSAFPFQHTSWRGTRLTGTSFVGVDLTGADFTGAQAAMSEWVDCALDGATFEGADLRGSFWLGCKLSEQALQRANLVDAEASDCFIAGLPWCPEVLRLAEQIHPVRRRHDGGQWQPEFLSMAELKLVLAHTRDGVVRVVDGSTGRLFLELRPSTLRGRGAAFEVGSRVLTLTTSQGEMLELTDHASKTSPLTIDLGVTRPKGQKSLACNIGGNAVTISVNEDNTVSLSGMDRRGDIILSKRTGRVRSLVMSQLAGVPSLIIDRLFYGFEALNPLSGELIGRFLRGKEGVFQKCSLAAFNGKMSVVSGYSSILIVDPFDGAPLKRLQDGFGGDSFMFNVADGAVRRDVLVGWSHDGLVRTVDVQTGRTLAAMTQKHHTSTQVGFAADRLVVASLSGVSDALTGDMFPWAGTQGNFRGCIAIGCVRGRGAVVYSGDGEFVVVDVATGYVLNRLANPARSGLRKACLAQARDTALLICGFNDGNIVLTDIATGSASIASPPVQSPIRALATLHHGDEIAWAALQACGIATLGASDGARKSELHFVLGGVEQGSVYSTSGELVLASSYQGCCELVYIDPITFEAGRRTILGPAEGTMLELQPEPSGGYTLTRASGDAARYWRAQGLIDGNFVVQHIDAMKRPN